MTNDLDNVFYDANTLLVEGPLRSGRKVTFDGNIVVMGDLNAGAEVSAGGHIIVMGALRGMAEAGLGEKGEEARVIALLLFPTQLRIAEHITCPPEGYRHMGVPEIAHIKDGKVIIEPYVVK